MPLSSEARQALTGDLAAATGHPVDLADLRHAGVFLLRQILTEGRVSAPLRRSASFREGSARWRTTFVLAVVCWTREELDRDVLNEKAESLRRTRRSPRCRMMASWTRG